MGVVRPAFEVPCAESSQWVSLLSKHVLPTLDDLLRVMLVYNPKGRLTPLKLLLQSIFDPVRAAACAQNLSGEVGITNFSDQELASLSREERVKLVSPPFVF